MAFPKDFLWGTATASYQIEGGVREGGKGPSIWDDFTAQPGRVLDGSDGSVACDHYHRFREDVALMAEMGIRNYRFSISWPRVLPEGVGRVNEEGLQFYSDLVDCLLAHGIRPFCTLYHWDLPRALHEKGAWLNAEMPDWFEEYTRVVARRLGDRVKDFFTINEPQCVIGLGYGNGEHAPGVRYPVRDQVRMIHQLLRCHGRAVKALREEVPGVRVGYAPCSNPGIPLTDSEADVNAARQAYMSVPPDERGLCWNVTWFSDPVILGRYPEDGLRTFGQYLPEGWEKDMAEICQPMDYYAQNIYQGMVWRAGENGPEHVEKPQGYPRTAIGWPITPEALYWGPRFLHERYGLPIIISENGMSCHDAVSLDGEVHDPNRIDYMRRYLTCLSRACRDGVPVAGYFYWSFLDNFEWAYGYTERFGLTYVDYQSQKRTPKDSCRWYRDMMAENGASL